MIKKEELVKEFREKFERMKQELGFKASYEELNDIFFIEDYVLERGYVAEKLPRLICRRICETYYSWIESLHNILVPAPGNLITMTESKIFHDDEKKQISNMIKKAMELLTRNSLIGLTKDKSEEAKFIDDAVGFWNNEFKPELIRIMKKINEEWKK